MIYKVSYVVSGSDLPGSIRNQQEQPQTGDEVKIGDSLYVVDQVHEIMPARGNFQFLHATVHPVGEKIIAGDE